MNKTKRPGPVHKVIFDTDPGVDDALALYFALAHPDIDVLGICSVFGNVLVEQASANALLLCQLAGQRVAVAQGASQALVKAPSPPPAFIHGDDGLGNLPTRPSLRGAIEQRPAAQFIVDTVTAHVGEVSLVAVGPLTNLAQALSLEPALPSLVRSVVLMGGTVAEPGNVSPVAEANVWNDPHAADRVLTAAWPLTMVGLDVTHQVLVPLALIERIAALQRHPATNTLLHAFRFYATSYANRHQHLAHTPGSYAHDLLAFIYLLHPGYFDVDRGVIRVATEGLAQGQTMLCRQPDRHYPQPGWGPEWPQCQACMSVDAPACLDLLERTLAAPWLNRSE